MSILWILIMMSLQATLIAPPPAPSIPPPIQWKSLQSGVEYARIVIAPEDKHPERQLHVVRIEPGQVKFRALLASEHGNKRRLAADWCKQFGLSIAINLGMYGEDHRTHIGYLRVGSTINNARWSNYRSVLALEPKGNDRASALLVDLPYDTNSLSDYSIVVQNLRLIKGDGINVWKPSQKRWSEAALAMDKKGRLLFLFCREAQSMWAFNRMILAQPLEIVRAMHLDGGAKASLSIHANGVDLDLFGSFETGFYPQDLNISQWEIPNVLGVVAEQAPSGLSTK